MRGLTTVFCASALSLCLTTHAVTNPGQTHRQTEPWTTLPPTPTLPPSGDTGYVTVKGTRLFYARYGHGAPVILLHGGLANGNYWGNQVSALSFGYMVIVVDLRGHGRSALPAGPISYDLMAADVVGLMDVLAIRQATIVGWSDGAIVGLAMAITHPDRVAKLFAYGANADASGLIAGGARRSAFAVFTARVEAEYEALSPNPKQFSRLREMMGRMWKAEPSFSQAMLASIHCPSVIADGQYDEIIRRDHTEKLAAAVPSAQLLIEPATGCGFFQAIQFV